jgi:hypothetical protein
MESCDLLESSASGTLLIDLDLDGTLPPVWLNEVQLQKVLVRLIRYFADSLAGATGAVCVKTSLQSRDSGSWGVAIEMRDVGRACDLIGLTRPAAWSTSPDPGMAELRRLVEAQGGAFELRAQPGRASHARLVFPTAETP